ncbi:DUF6119 family protein [Anaerostipes faecalis]|uniref:DUF6119 family protein n=1 Tax=Anaerostipes faecalis TaxID=2738446 RepID=UPI002ED2710E
MVILILTCTIYILAPNVYAMTAGYGNHIIKKYIEKSWGLYLMPKLLGDDEGVIKEVKENNFYGNTLSLNKANRYSTNIGYEKKLSSVFRELSLEIDDDVLEQLGFVRKKQTKRKTSILLKDSLNVRQSVKIDELKEALEMIYKVEKRSDMYSMGYFLNSKKVGISNKDLLSKLIEDILNENIDKICLIGDDYFKYCVGASEYIVQNEEHEEYFSSENPITFKLILELIKEDKKLSRTFVEKVLKKWTISTISSDGKVVLYPISIFNALQGFVEYGEKGIPCFLMQGEWYCFDDRYTELLSDEFKKIIKSDKEKVQQLKDKFSLNATGNDENLFNDSFFAKTDVIVAHKSLTDNVEIADLIYWDEDNVYLMCNKARFDGSGSRDLTNQMWAAANYFQNKMNSSTKTSFLEIYYEIISERYQKNKHNVPLSMRDFKKLFNKKVSFVAGYMTGYTLQSKSLYAKYLTIDSYKKMNDMGYGYICMNLGK